MSALNKEDILEADDTADLREVEVPEWGGSVYVGEMTAAERDRLEDDTYDLDERGQMSGLSMVGYRARVLALTLRDEDGERVFDYEDWRKIADKAAKPVDRVFEVATEINGLSEEDIEETVKK
jgi:hypothetical protein